MNHFVAYRLLIPTVRTLRLIGCLAVLLAFSPLVQAQDDTPAPVVDTTVAIDAPVEEETLDDSDDDLGVKIGSYKEPELRQVPDTAIQRLQKLPEFEYANDPEYWTREPQPKQD